MSVVLFLILFPLIPALLLLITKHGFFRNALVHVSVLALSAGAIYLLCPCFDMTIIPSFYNQTAEIMNKAILFGEIALILYFCYVGIKNKKWWVPLLSLTQGGVLMYYEFMYHEPITENILQKTLFTVDYFSIIMALIIGIIGGLICIYALAYMKDYHHHHTEIKDKSNTFFFILFLFLTGMFGVVFSNHFVWMYFFWEITTLCSFVLIAYSGTEEAKNNAFRALIFNLLGGVGFAIGIAYLYNTEHIVELDKMLALGKTSVMIPAILMAFAGMTKSAQFPFSNWLTGAMIAPTPVSALLHSSTMVKAGVFIIIKLSPIFYHSIPGLLVSLIGGITFVFAAFIAISQSNAKRVLAYSTISNLGLIVLCAGIGTAQATWAAILLLVFHAVAKGLLFLCVGSVEHKIGSRDIEDMDGLLRRMPQMAVLIIIGIAGMFLAPFGMLISKYAALKAIVDAHPLLAVLVAYGGATTLFFWTKWLGKLITISPETENKEKQVSANEWIALYILGIMTVAVCGLFPVMSKYLIDPFISVVYGQTVSMSQGNITIMLIMLSMLLVLPFALRMYISKKLDSKKLHYTTPYMSGVNAESHFTYHGSMNTIHDYQSGNYYLQKFFGEKLLYKYGVIITTTLLIILLGAGIV